MDKSVKEVFLIKVVKSSEREVSTSHYRKIVYFALCHTLHHYGPLWIIFAYTMYISYILQHYFLLYFICNDFSISTIFSPSFLVFKCYFLFYIYILWFYILLSLRSFGSAFLYMAVFFRFSFRTFDVETSF